MTDKALHKVKWLKSKFIQVIVLSQWGMILKLKSLCVPPELNFDKLQSRKSQAGTQVQISDLEFSLETDFPTTNPL